MKKKLLLCSVLYVCSSSCSGLMNMVLSLACFFTKYPFQTSFVLTVGSLKFFSGSGSLNNYLKIFESSKKDGMKIN